MQPAFLWRNGDCAHHLWVVGATVRGAGECVGTGCGECDGVCADSACNDRDDGFGADFEGVHHIHAGSDEGNGRTSGEGKRKWLIALLAGIKYPFFGDKTQDVGCVTGFEEAAIAELCLVEAQWIDGTGGDGCLDELDSKKRRRHREGQSSDDGCGYFPEGDGASHRSKRKSSRYRECLASRVHGARRR